MNKRIVAAVAAFGIVAGAMAATKDFELSSPDGKLNVSLEVGETVTYSLSHDGTLLLDRSQVSMSLDDGTVYGVDSRFIGKKSRTCEGEIDAVNYKKKKVEDNFNELTLRFKGFNIIFRAYDDGMAYRFVSLAEEPFKVKSEQAEFNFPDNWTAYVPYVRDFDRNDFSRQFFNSFENRYSHIALSEWDKDRLAFLPLVVEASLGKKVCITEADLLDYPGMYLYNGDGGHGLHGVFAPYPDRMEQGGHNMLQMLVQSRKDYIAEFDAGTSFPWRVVAVSVNDSQLADNDMVYRLATPPAGDADYSWVKPGKVAWDWWNDWNIYGVDFRAGINNDTYKYYIDFASEHGIEYVILDEGWAVNLEADLMKVIPEIDLKMLSGDYEKAVKNTEEYKQATSELGIQSGETSSKMSELTSATGEQAAAAGDAADADQILSDQFGATTDGVNELATALSEVISALDTYYGFARSETDALLDLRSGYLDLEEAVKKNGATLDTYTEKGIANRSALNDLAKSAVKAAEAQAQNGRTVDEVNGTMNEAHDKFVHYAQAMGASAEEAERMAEASGLGKDAAQKLIDAVKTANATPLEPKTADVNIEPAQSKLGELASKTTALPNGNVVIYGNNQPAMLQIAEVVGAKVDPKTGNITADKTQFDAILALANGAKLDPKTGVLKGDNSDYWASVCKANGWTIDTKTGIIKGDNGQALAAVNAVNNTKVLNKYFTVSDSGTAQLNINRVATLDAMQISNKSYTITERLVQMRESIDAGQAPHIFEGKRATGGPIIGPGTGTSDSVPIWASNGEYVINARSTAKYRRELEAINGGYFEQFKATAGYASGGYVQATPAAPYVPMPDKVSAKTAPVSVTVNVNGSKAPEVVARETVEIVRRELGVRS